MTIHESIQGSQEWLDARKGKMTGSHGQAIASAGKGLETYVYELVAEKYAKESESYTNPDMERGNELEDVAVGLYELETGTKVTRTGFWEKDEYTGCSPDGLVGIDGMIEIKCQNNKNHFHTLMTGKIESKYIWQIQMNLLITKRKWCDYIGFNPNFDRDLYITRIYPDPDKQRKLKLGIIQGNKLIKELEKKYGE